MYLGFLEEKSIVVIEILLEIKMETLTALLKTSLSITCARINL